MRACSCAVIHAGIYYPTGSLKAALCVEGKHLLYEYACSHSIPHRRIGKLIVAQTPAQVRILHALQAQACANGVHDCEWVTAKECERLEPAVKAAAGGLLSASTGIIDSHVLMEVLQGEAEEVRSAALTFAMDSRCEVQASALCTRCSHSCPCHKIRQSKSHNWTRACGGVSPP